MRGAKALIAHFADSNDPRDQGPAIKMLVTLFGSNNPIDFEVEIADERSRLLGQLLRYTYTCLGSSYYRGHTEPHSIVSHKDVLAAGNTLFSLLIDTPGSEACRILLEFANEQELFVNSKRLRLLARRRATADAEAEFSAFDVRDMVAFETIGNSERHRTDTVFEFLLQVLNIFRGTVHGRISLLLVTGGVAIMNEDLVKALAETFMKMFFNIEKTFVSPPPMYGIGLIVLGITFYLYCWQKGR